MNLYNVLITDDESFIVDWLASLLEEQTDLNISIYRAYTPAKALELIERVRIDLLISDIKMPSYSGFDLSKRMQQLWPGGKTILLTAYSDFNYAQQAIQQGVISYILKTADDQEILSEIRKVLDIIDRESNQLALMNTIEKNLKNFETRLNAQIFFLWLKGYYTTQNLAENVQTLGFQSEDTCSFMLLICRTDFPESPNARQLQNIMKPFQVQRIIEHYLAPHLMHASYEIQDDLLLGILQSCPADNKDIAQIISSALEPAQAVCMNTLNCRISCLISSEGSAEEIPLFWSKGKSLLSQFSGETDFIFHYDYRQKMSTADSATEEDWAAELLKSSYYKTMSRNLKRGDRESFLQQLTCICSYLSQNSNWYDNRSLQIYFSLVLVFINYINQKELSTRIAFHTSTGILFRPWLADSWSAIEDSLYQMTESLLTINDEVIASEETSIVQNIQDYIEAHILEDISLLDLANATGYSTSYLSQYYSDTTGATISEYLASKKLEHIAQLMQDTDMNIGEIASYVGFHSRTYFNSYIKRLTGMSPQQFRESLETH